MPGSTIRTHLEAIRDVPGNLRDDIARERAFDHAVAALRILDEAERLGNLKQRIYPGDDRVAILDPVGVRDAKEPHA